MIKIYLPNEVNVHEIISNPENWDYPISELSYLLKYGRGAYVLVDDRLYEVPEEEER
jgi:hypothetical protein